MFSLKSYFDHNFEDLDMPEKMLSNIEFEQCVFYRCNFSEVMFSGCKFLECRFVQCNFSLARLGFSIFDSAEFDECKLLGIDWTQAQWPQFSSGSAVSFNQCILDSGSFMGQQLKLMKMRHCRAHDVDFRDANLSQAEVEGTSFSHSLFHRTNLTKANFTDATGFHIDVNNNAIKGAIFSRLEALTLLESLGIELVD
ncbi:pentapeptide repeat-containing protein [Shewanella sp.]|uniref:pentapeptide repeat-containing protein n=1 Tax=Shewanella sp. TaxID=50422 RepID=UPI0040542F8D